jgi:hypothetical protein
MLLIVAVLVLLAGIINIVDGHPGEGLIVLAIGIAIIILANLIEGKSPKRF